MADSKFEKDDALNRAIPASQPASGGATDIFATYAPAHSAADDELAQLLGSAVPKQVVPPPVALPEPVQPIVHERIFKNDPTAEHGSQALMDLLKSSPPAPPPPAPTAALPNSGFTQLLRALNFEQPKAEASKPVQPSTVPVPPAPEPLPSMAQLLRTIDEPEQKINNSAPLPTQPPLQASSSLPPTQAAGPYEHPVAPTSEPGSFTQLFSTALKSEAAAPAKVPSSFTQMFAALETPAASAEPGTQTAPPPTSASTAHTDDAQVAHQAVSPTQQPASPAGSFTQMFAALETSAPFSADPAHEVTPVMMADEALASSGDRTAPLQASINLPASPPPALPASPVSLTQMFNTLDLPVDAPAPSQVPPSLAPAPPTAPPASSFTQLFSTLEMPPATVEAARPAPLPTAPASPAAGSFTQMFQALDADPVVETGKPYMSSTAAKEPPHAASSEPAGGSFTQMFASLDSAPARGPVHQSNDPASHASAQPPAGSFTQMFRTLDAAPAAETTQPAEPFQPIASPPSSSSTPVSFTQIFSTLTDPSEKSPYAEPSHPASPSSSGSFTQMFGALGAPPNEAASKEVGYSQPPARSQTFAQPLPETPAPGSGGLTQLLRTLDTPAAASQGYQPPPAAPTVSHGSSFTSAYAMLDGSAPPAPSQPGPPQPALSALAPPLPAPVSSGPSEFTRILSASALREAGIRTGGTGATPPIMPSASPASAIPMSQVAMPQVAMPQMPSMAMPGAGGGAPAAPSFAPPALPQLKAPEIKIETPPAQGMGKYLPLLLILIIFLLVALLIAVIFLMKK